jgi:hypothetical protein
MRHEMNGASTTQDPGAHDKKEGGCKIESGAHIVDVFLEF